MDELSTFNFDAMGKCIYCGSKDNLSDEHIVPYGLGGKTILPDASCRECAVITGRIEQHVLRGPLRPVRIWCGIQSRTKHQDGPQSKSLELQWPDGTSETIEVGLIDGPIVCAFPIFDLAGLVKPEGYVSGIRVLGLNAYAFGKSPEEVVTESGAKELTWTETVNACSFARMLAKICYTMCVAQAGTSIFDGQPTVVDSILGKRDDIGRWVGTVPIIPSIHLGQLHRITFRHEPRDGYVRAEIQLFAESGTPVYDVIIGRTARWLQVE